MEFCVFVIVAIVISIINKANSQNTNNTDSSSETVNLDDIFNEVVKSAGNSPKSDWSTRSGNEPSPGLPMPQQRSRRKSNRAVLDKSASNRVNDSKNYLTTPSKHDDHICEDVNYDNISSLEGGTGSFNLGEPEPSVVLYEPTKVSIGREDLLKSFIISEVMQRYDINRIYSRIPSVKSDD